MRTLWTLLALALVVGLVGCSKEEPTGSDPNPTLKPGSLKPPSDLPQGMTTGPKGSK